MTRDAPDFSLFDQDGIIRKLKDYAGKWLVVFFYPMDGSVNCTREACAFRDEHEIIGQFGNAEIIGINKASISSHKRFAVRNHLSFPLLSDPEAKITKAYGAWKTNNAQSIFDKLYATRRNTYIVNPKGRIVQEFIGIKTKNHVDDVIHSLQSLQNLVKN
jgi:peroxiredoxin Q/BCP